MPLLNGADHVGAAVESVFGQGFNCESKRTEAFPICTIDVHEDH